MNYRTQKILLTGHIDDEAEAYLTWLIHQSNSLYNSVLFEVRQAHFAQCETRTYFDQNDMYRTAYKDRYVKASYAQLCKQFKSNKHYIALGGQQGQQCIKSVVEAIRSYNGLLKSWWQGELENRPRVPNYRKSGGVYQVAFTSQNINYDDVEGCCRLSISKVNKPELLNPVVTIIPGSGFKSEQLSELRIVPLLGKLWAEYVYKVESKQAIGLDYSQGIGIDPGVSNLLAATTSQGKSFIVCGRKIKSINQRYNKKVAKYKQGKPQQRSGISAGNPRISSAQKYWDDYLAKLTHKRNCQMRDACSKTARFVINYCLNHGIGNIVFGWGQGIKTKSNLGDQNNQNFVQIPTARLKEKIKQLAESVGIIFTETEEAYTSKSDFLAGDLLFKFGEKPKEYKFSGRRISRGTYRSKFGLISADALGGINCLKKVATQLGISLAEVGRECLTVPKRYELTCLSKSYRKRAETMLQLVS